MEKKSRPLQAANQEGDTSNGKPSTSPIQPT